MPRPLLVSANDIRDQLAGSSMARFINNLGNTRATGVAVDDAVTARLEKEIRGAQSKLEQDCELRLFQTVITSSPVKAGLVRTTVDAPGDYDVIEDAYPYNPVDFNLAVQIRLKSRPVVALTEVRIQYGPSGSELAILRFPDGWITPEAKMGLLNIVPVLGGGSPALAGALIMLPIATQVLRGQAFPNAIHVDYTAGFLPANFDAASDDVADAAPDYSMDDIVTAVKYLAASRVLRAVRLAKGAGGGSISADGLSQSFNAGRFEQELQDYEKQVADLVQSIRGHFIGFQGFIL